VCSRVSTAGKHNQIADGNMRRGHADSTEGVAAQSGKGAHSTYMGTPEVGVRMGAIHEDRQITRSLRTCWVDWSSLYFE
jgi:hypothetical protein